MRTPWLRICCVLVVLSLLAVTASAAKKSKNKKLSEDKSTKDKSTKDKSTKDKSTKQSPPSELSSDINPKLRNVQNKQNKKKTDKKGQDGPRDVPVIADEVLHIKINQEKFDAPAAAQTKEHRRSPADNCVPAPAERLGTLVEIEKNVTALWSQVKAISQPVHIHVHGGRASSFGKRSRHGSKDRRHGDRSSKGHQPSEKERLEQADKKTDQGRSPSYRCHPSQTGCLRTKDVDKLAKSQQHHNKSISHGGHGYRGRDQSHKGHYSSQVGHGRNDSYAGHGVRRGDHSHKSYNSSKHHSYGHRRQGYSPAKGHGYRRGGSFREGHGHSTHVHIHVSIDERPDIPTRTRPGDRHPDSHRKTAAKEEPLYARCDFRTFDASSRLSGYVLLRQTSAEGLQVKVNISDLAVDQLGAAAGDVPETLHGFHVHEFGDFSQGCASFGGHFNPEGTVHGGLDHSVRHVGDWGNIQVNAEGLAVVEFSLSNVSLSGRQSIFGRGIVIHGKEDDLGQGDTEASRASGNAGARLGCCIIGWTKTGPGDVWQEIKPQEQPGTTPTVDSRTHA